MEVGMDADEARMNRYAEAIYDGAEAVDPDEKAVILPAVIAVADEEQAELRAELAAAQQRLATVDDYANALLARKGGWVIALDLRMITSGHEIAVSIPTITGSVDAPEA